MTCGSLAGTRILVAEDEYYLASDAHAALAAAGAEVVGPAPTVDDAISLIARGGRIDGALLDINLRGTMAFAVADALAARGVPFVFATGYDRMALPPRFGTVPLLEKPVDLQTIVRLFERLTAASRNLA